MRGGPSGGFASPLPPVHPQVRRGSCPRLPMHAHSPSSMSTLAHSLLVMTRQSGSQVCTPLACTHCLPRPLACSCLSVTSHLRWRRWRIRLYGLRCVTFACFTPQHTSLTTWVAGWATSLLTRYLTAPRPFRASVAILLQCELVAQCAALSMLLFWH